MDTIGKQTQQLLFFYIVMFADLFISFHMFYMLQQEVVSYGYVKICEILLDGGASPNISGYENSTPLHEAAKCDGIEEAKLLLKHGADKNLCDQYGKKAMYVYMHAYVHYEQIIIRFQDNFVSLI